MTVLPVYNMITVPDSSIYIKIDDYKKMTGRVPENNEKVTVIIAKNQISRKQMENDSFYPIGISGVITEVNEQGYLVIRLSQRVNLDEIFVYRDKTIELTVSRRQEMGEVLDVEAKRRIKDVKEQMLIFSQNYQWGQLMRVYIAGWNTMGEIAAAASPWMSNSNQEKYELLAEDDVKKRFDKMEAMIYENLELFKVQAQAQTAQQEDHQKLYREAALKKQIEYLQKELDEMHPENLTDLRKLEIKINESEMNETARKEAEKLLNRLKSEGQNSAESGMLMDYLDFLISLPWKKEDAKKIELARAEEILDEDHFGLEKVKKRILEQIAVMTLKEQQSGSILLFVGAPGTGKTSIGQSIAKALGRKYVRVSLGGVRDEADIRGHRRTYIGAMPGRIIDGIQKSGVSNPVMVLDEVDKLSVSYNGDPASALLEVLDPEQNHTFTDHYLNVPFDLSDVLFICTANSLDTIPEPLLNRMEVIRFQGYTPLEKEQIAICHLLPKAKKAVGIKEKELQVDDGAITHIIEEYTKEAGVRGLKKRMDTLCRSTAVKLVKGAKAPVRITADNLRDYLDMSPIRQKSVKEAANPGIVTGLAWTPVGGEILYIETMLTKGSGKITVTGQLGDVMKESTQIAVSLVKSIYNDKAELFEENNLHIHVPDGATPKDGPSAGIALTTALSSLVTGISVSPQVAMTGEVSLQGNVNPIGGLPEKLMAAGRSGVKKVFIPEDNVEDLKDVAKEIREQLEIIPVRTVHDVLKQLKMTAKA